MAVASPPADHDSEIMRPARAAGAESATGGSKLRCVSFGERMRLVEVAQLAADPPRALAGLVLEAARRASPWANTVERSESGGAGFERRALAGSMGPESAALLLAGAALVDVAAWSKQPMIAMRRTGLGVGQIERMPAIEVDRLCGGVAMPERSAPSRDPDAHARRLAIALLRRAEH